MSIIRHIRFLSLIIILTVYAINTFAQLPDYPLQLFDYSVGIKPGNIRAITRDKQGFLWILYPRNVQRFDGRKIVSLSSNDELTHVYCDEEGAVWFTSLRKLFYYDEEKEILKEAELSGKDSAVGVGPVFNLPGRRTMVITSRGFWEKVPGSKKFIPSLIDLKVPPPYNTRAFAEKGPVVFIGHAGKIYRCNTQTGAVDSLPDKNVMRIYPLTEDSVLISTWDISCYWLNFRYSSVREIEAPVEKSKEQTKSGISKFAIRGFIQIAPGKFFTASLQGLFEYNSSTQQFKKVLLGYKGKEIAGRDFANYLYVDKENYLWMASPEGVGRIPLKGQSFGLIRIRQKDENLSLGIDNIRSITGDEKGNLWLATGSGFVRMSNNYKDIKIYLPKEGSTTQLAFPSVRGLVYDGKNLILGPSDLGLWIFNPVTEKYKRPLYASAAVQEASENDFVDGITTLNNGDHLVMGRDALYLLKGKTYQLSFVENPAAKENTNFAFQGKDGYIWLTTMRGLHLLDSNLRYITKVQLPTGNPYVSSGVILQDNHFLFSVDKGLYTVAYDGKKTTVKKYTNAFDGLSYLYSFIMDKNILWATSENGIYRYDLTTGKLNLYDYSDNVQGYGFNFNSWYKSADGLLFLGGVNGINYVRTENFSFVQDSLRVFIIKARNGKNDSLLYSLNQQAEIPYNHRSLEVEFASPYFNNPEKIKYRYRIIGFDEEWKVTGNNNSVRLTSLPAGDYTLEVQASINNVDWVNADNRFRFHIKRPHWQSWWFISLLLSAIVASLWFFIRNRNKKLMEKQEELEAEQAINYFSTSIYEQQTVDAILWDVARNCIGRLKFEDCVIYMVDEKRNVLVQTAAYGYKSPQLFQIKDAIEIPIGEGITGSVAASGIAEIVNDTSKDERYIEDGERRLSEITVPIIADGKVLGVIDCEHSKKRFFTQRHLSILGTIATLCANKIVKAKAETEKKEAEKILMETQQKMADVEMQALRAQMNPHFIFNCLNSINRYIVKSDQATASLYLTRFAKLIRLILDNSNSKTVTLTNELEALRLYIEMEAIRFEKQFTYSIHVAEEINTDGVYVPPLIIQPYVENAIWHGLLHKETAGHLSVNVCCGDNNVLECIVEDNGVGRERAKELKSKSAGNKKSLGMKLTEERLALLNRQTKVDTTVKVEDLVAANGSPAGTRVIIKIPLDDN